MIAMLGEGVVMRSMLGLSWLGCARKLTAAGSGGGQAREVVDGISGLAGPAHGQRRRSTSLALRRSGGAQCAMRPRSTTSIVQAARGQGSRRTRGKTKNVESTAAEKGAAGEYPKAETPVIRFRRHRTAAKESVRVLRGTEGLAAGVRQGFREGAGRSSRP